MAGFQAYSKNGSWDVRDGEGYEVARCGYGDLCEKYAHRIAAALNREPERGGVEWEALLDAVRAAIRDLHLLSERLCASPGRGMHPDVHGYIRKTHAAGRIGVTADNLSRAISMRGEPGKGGET